MFDQTNNDDAVSHVSIRNFKRQTNRSDLIQVSWFLSDLVENYETC